VGGCVRVKELKLLLYRRTPKRTQRIIDTVAKIFSKLL
jgi:hypothetical protein